MWVNIFTIAVKVVVLKINGAVLSIDHTLIRHPITYWCIKK